MRSSLIADYLRSLRILGRASEGAERAWRQLCVTCDPLVSGRGAADQLRLYLDQVEQELGPIPEEFPCAGYRICADPEEIRRARRTWADHVMETTLNFGSSSRIVASHSRAQAAHPEDSSGAAVAADDLNSCFLRFL